MTPQDKIKQANISLEEFEDAVGDELGIPKNLRQAMIGQESGGRHRNKDGSVLTSGGKAKQYGGARGRWQVLPGTAKKYGMNPDDEFDNAYAGMMYLKELYDKARPGVGSDADAWAAAVAGYHGGESQVRHINKTGSIAERNDGHISTPNYVDSVLKRWSDLEARAGSDGNSPPVGAASGSRLGDEEIARRQNVEQAVQAFEGMKAEAARLVSSKDEFERARGFGLLDKANKLAEQIGQAAGDLVETGPGKGGWAYVKPRENFSYQARPHWTESAFRALRPGQARAISDQNAQIQAERERFQGRSWLGQQAEKFFTEFASGDDQMSPEAKRDLAIRRQALGLEYTPPEERSGPRRALDALRSGAHSLVATVPQGAGELATTIIEATHPGRKFEEGLSPADVGKQLTDQALRSVQAGAPLDPDDHGWLTAKIPQAVGSALGFTLGGRSKVASAVLGAVTNLQQIVCEYDRVKGPKEYRELAKAVGALTGTLEAAGLGKTFAAWGGEKRLLQSIKEFGEEGLQEYVNELSNDYNLRLIAGDQTRSLNPLSANKLEAGALGAIAAVPFQAGALLAGRKAPDEAAETPPTAPTAPPVTPPTAPAAPPAAPTAPAATGVPDGVRIFRSGEVLPAREKGVRHIPVETASGEAVTVVAPEMIDGQRVSEDMARPWAEAAIQPTKPEKVEKQTSGPVTFGEGVTVHDIDDKPRYDPAKQKSVTFKAPDGTTKAAIIPKGMSRTDGIAVARQMLPPTQQAPQTATPQGKVRFGDEVEVFLGDSAPEYDPSTQKIVSFNRGMRSYVVVAPKSMGRAEAIHAAQRRLDRGKPGVTPAQAGAEAGRGQTSDAPLLSPDAVVNPEGGVPVSQNITSGSRRPGEVARPKGQVDKENNVPLAQYVIKRGGIRYATDGKDKGEIAYLLGKEGGRPGLVNNKNGLTLDMMREDATSAGYGPYETIDDFLRDLIDHGDSVFPQGYNPLDDPKRLTDEDKADLDDAEAFQNFLYDPDMRELYDKVSSGQATEEDEKEFIAGARRYRLSDEGIDVVVQSGRSERARSEAKQAFGDDEVVLARRPGEDRWAMVAPSAQHAGRYQLTRMDTRGMASDSQFGSRAEAIDAAVVEGFTEKLEGSEADDVMSRIVESQSKAGQSPQEVSDEQIRTEVPTETRPVTPTTARPDATARKLDPELDDSIDDETRRDRGRGLSQYVELRLANHELIEQLEDLEPWGRGASDAMDVFDEGVAKLYEDAERRGIEIRHVRNLVAAIQNWHKEKAQFLDAAEREARRIAVDKDNPDVERAVAALDALYEDETAIELLKLARLGNDEALNELTQLADEEYGIRPESIRESVRRYRDYQARAAVQSRPVSGNLPQGRDGASDSGAGAREAEAGIRRTLSVDVNSLQADRFDAYMTSVEKWINHIITKGDISDDLASSVWRRYREVKSRRTELVKKKLLPPLTENRTLTKKEVEDKIARERDERERIASRTAQKEGLTPKQLDILYEIERNTRPVVESWLTGRMKGSVEDVKELLNRGLIRFADGGYLYIDAPERKSERALRERRQVKELTEEEHDVYQRQRMAGVEHDDAFRFATGRDAKPAFIQAKEKAERPPLSKKQAISRFRIAINGRHEHLINESLADIQRSGLDLMWLIPAPGETGRWEITDKETGRTIVASRTWRGAVSWQEDGGEEPSQPESVVPSRLESTEPPSAESGLDGALTGLAEIFGDKPADTKPEGKPEAKPTDKEKETRRLKQKQEFDGLTDEQQSIYKKNREMGRSHGEAMTAARKAGAKKQAKPNDDIPTLFGGDAFPDEENPKPDPAAKPGQGNITEASTAVEKPADDLDLGDIFDQAVAALEEPKPEPKPLNVQQAMARLRMANAETDTAKFDRAMDEARSAGVIIRPLTPGPNEDGRWRIVDPETETAHVIARLTGGKGVWFEQKERIEDVIPPDDWEGSLFKARSYGKALIDAGVVPADVAEEWRGVWADDKALIKAIKKFVGKTDRKESKPDDLPFEPKIRSEKTYAWGDWKARAVSDGQTIRIIYTYREKDYAYDLPVAEYDGTGAMADKILIGSGVPTGRVKKGSMNWDYLRNLGHGAAYDVNRQIRESDDAGVELDAKPLARKLENLPQHIANLFAEGRAFKTIVDARREVGEFLGMRIDPGTTEAKQADELIEQGVVLAARKIVEQHKGDPRATYDALVDLYYRQPNLTVRTSVSVANQAYSTPAPLAFLASHLAGINDKTTVYEPSAGNGMLLVAANPEKVHANEIDKRRADALRAQEFKTVTEWDSSGAGAHAKVDVVIANPPFGVVKNDAGVSQKWKITSDYSTTEIDHAIAIQALASMNDSGTAVLILGGINKLKKDDMERRIGYNQKAKRQFYAYLYGRYNVVDHFTVAGELYSRQGAGWPVDVIVIKGRGKSTLVHPAKYAPEVISSYEDLRRKIKAPALHEKQPSAGVGAGRKPEGGVDPGNAGAGNTGQLPLSGTAGRQGRADDKAGQSAETGGGVSEGGVLPGRPDRGSDSAGARPDAESGAVVTPPGAGSVPAQEGRRPAGEQAGASSDRGNKSGGVGASGGVNLDDVFDQAVADLEASEKPQPTKDPLREAGQKAVEGVKDTAKGLDDALKGLADLFGDPNKLSSGFTFDEKTYAKAKPHFEAAYAHFKDAVNNITEAMQKLVLALKEKVGFTVEQIKALKPYIVRFVQDVTAQESKGPDTKPETRSESSVEDSDTHRAYQPNSSANPVGTLVPMNMATSTEEALKELETRVGSLDEFIAKKLNYDVESIGEYFSGEQVDALAMAIDNLGRGVGFVIGDQTGIGKGRVVAGVIRYALSIGKTPIFVTEKPALFGDMIRDLTDIGIPTAGVQPSKTNHDAITPLITNNNEEIPLSGEAYAWIAERDAAKVTGRKVPPKPSAGWLKTPTADQHAPLIEKVTSTGAIRPHGYDVVFTTYAQMQKIKGESAPRHRLLDRISEGAILIFDESHNAGGGAPKFKDGELIEDRAQYARALARKAHGVFFSSATYAKRPEVMDLYSRTSLGRAVANPMDLAPLIQRGGVPLQQVVASMLTRAGQYLRRERSFKGIAYETMAVEVNKDAASRIPAILSRIVAFDAYKAPAVQAIQDELMGEGGVANDSAMSVSSTNFTALMHNVVDQMLLSLKVAPAIDLAVKSLEAGEKPVLTLANTMGAFIEQYTTDNEIQPGQPLQLDFRAILERYLERSRRISIKTDKGFGSPVQHHYLTDEELGPAAVAHYAETMRMIRSLDMKDMPISPIDYLHHELRRRGYKTAEITGRNHTLDYSTDVPTYKLRPTSESSTAGKKQSINGFNEGAIDVLIINQSGSTGISLHANRPFKDTRRRVMILIQPERNIDTHMQMLGRINRTGQVTEAETSYHRAPAGKPAAYGLPRYVQMAANIPAENRPAAILAKKMASLNANTTAAKGSAVTSTEAPDFMNKYGGEVIVQLIRDTPELNQQLDYPVDLSKDDYGDSDLEDVVKKVTGRLPLLPLETQVAVYERIESEYKDLIERLDAMGTNDLDAKTLDLRAEVVESKTLSEGVGRDPFTAAVTIEKSRVRKLGKPLPKAEVLSILSEELGETITTLDQAEAKGLAWAKQTKEEVDKEHKEFIQVDLNLLDKRIEAAADTVAREKALDPSSSRALKAEKEFDQLVARRQQVQADANMQFIKWSGKISVLYPGAPVELKTDQGSLYGVVSKVARKADGPKNPIAGSGWRVTFLVADAARSINLPMSQLKTDENEPAGLFVRWRDTAPIFDPETMDVEVVDMLEAFERGQSISTEMRYIVTGNLLRGFDAVESKGQIVNFTTANDEVRQGILMPRGYQLSDVKQKPIIFRRPAGVLEFLKLGRAARVESANDKGILEVITHHSGRGVTFDVPSPKGVGGRYYLNKTLIEIIGGEGFVKQGGRMKVTVDWDTAERLIQALHDGAVGNMPTSFRARNLIQDAQRISDEESRRLDGNVGDMETEASAILHRFQGEEGIEARVVRGEKGYNVVLFDTEANEAASRVRIFPKIEDAIAEARRLVPDVDKAVRDAAEMDISGLMRLKKSWTLTPLREHRDYASAIRDVRFRVSSSKTGVIYGNEHAHFLLWKVVSTRSKDDVDFRGLRMTAGQAIRAANDMLAATFLTNGDPVARAQVIKFSRALKQMAVGGEDVHYVRVSNRRGWRDVRRTVYHELTHSAEPRTVRGGEWFKSQPIFDKVAGDLAGNRYSPEKYLSETVARVLAGQYREMGLTIDEATDFLSAYFDHLDENIGPAAVHEFRPLDVSPEMRPQLRKAQQNELSGRRQEVRGTNGGDGGGGFAFDRGEDGVQKGREGGSPQVSGIDGDEPAPVASLSWREKLGRKIGTTQAIAQLLNPRTIAQNLIGNAAFSGAKNLSTVAAIPLDKFLSLKTKQRQVSAPSLRSQYHDFVDGFVDIWSAVKSKDYSHLQSNKYELHNERIFSSKIGQFFEDAMDITLRGPDRGAFLAAYNDAVDQIMRGYERSGEKFTLDKVHERATMEAHQAIFQDKNLISDTMVGLKKLINRFSPFGEKAHFGLADLIGLKYPRVPSGLVMRAIEYSPYSLAKALKDSAIVLAGKGDTFSQREAAQAFGKGMIGTSFGAGLGVLLQSLGILIAPDDDKRGVGAVERTEGLFGYQVNFSALKRYAMGGLLDVFQSGNVASGRLKDGDKLYSIDWFQPWAFSLAMGASAARAVRKGEMDRGVFHDTLAAIDAASSALVDESILRNVRELTERGVKTTARRVATDTPASFVPGILGQVRRAVDERAREIERGDGAKGISLEALQKVMNRLPAASNRLREKRDLLDRPVPTRDAGAGGVASSFLPGRLATHRPHAYLDEMRRADLGTTGTRKRDDETPAEFRVRRSEASQWLDRYGLGLVRSDAYKKADRETQKEALIVVKERIYRRAGSGVPSDSYLSPVEILAAARRRISKRHVGGGVNNP